MSAADRALAFRWASAGDVAAIVALVESAYRGEASRAGWTTEADLLDGQRIDAQGVTALIESADASVLLAESDGELVACCELRRAQAPDPRRGRGGATGPADAEPTSCYFGMFAVRPSAQGGGLGRRVIAHAERLAREDWGCERMRMTVIDLRTELIAWYERRGYRRSGVFEPFPYGDARFGIPRRPDLRFEVLEKPLQREDAA
ncbi:MAG TPA: GNAT family N-acetyltransferase [Dokdonella sp.]|uniref:GNAT family N-acetyltransferase n=1 Tax=Dokdonella sp. TaxID=2291710 RepID=UPI002C13BE53|nr:GNAT family N-acetyltransferase [Dokdonella sp.]HUD40457.1 GNAT family N-acetyltransferase [Dokdonella sp.]